MTDGPSNPVLHKQIHPSLQFLILVVLTISLMIMGLYLGEIIVNSSLGAGAFDRIAKSNSLSSQSQNILWIFQLTSTTLPLLLSPIFFSYVIMREPDDYLKTSFHFPWLLLVIVFLTMMLSNPLLEFIGNINQKLDLPKSMLDQEKDLQQASDTMMQMKNFGSMLFNLVFIGLVTAIAEEFLFRGCFQTIFIKWLKNKHVAVWITAILFSAFHMEFLGFLPRLLLGLFFGYFVLWSGSVWTSVWAHFINNGTIVIITYLFQNKFIKLDPDDQHNFTIAGYLISFIITLLLLFIYQYISNKRQLADINGEELG